MKKLFLILFLFVFGVSALFADTDTAKIDSILTYVEDYTIAVSKLRKIPINHLTNYLETTTDDLSKCKIYNALCWFYFNSDPPKAMEYAKLQQPLAEKSGNQDAIINSYDNLAYLYQGFSENEKAITYMLKALKVKEELNDITGVSTSLAGLAGVYYKMNNFKLALNYFNQSLEIENKTEKSSNEGYVRQGAIIGNIGLCYVGLGEIDKGLENYLKAVELYIEHGLEESNGSFYGNIGLIYLKDKQDYNQALIYLKKAALLHEKNEDISALSTAYGGLCEIYSIQNDFANALIYGKKALKNAKLSEDKGSILEANKSLALVFYNNKDYQLAYEYIKAAFEVKDSIFNETSSQQIAEMQTKYDTEKKETENNLLKTKQALDKAALDKKATQQYILLIGLGLTLIIVFYVVYSLNEKKKINKLLNTKNQIIEEKNKDITDSINYAKRIQGAILPEENLILAHYESFIYYQPKDIVSGDFYWIKEIGNKFYFSVVDCTGHGVPGAFMSIIGFNSLNRIVEDLQLSETGLILDKLNELVLHSIRKQDKDGSSIRDGMDISLCCIDLENETLEFSGANNPLYLIRTTTNTTENLPITLTEKDYNLIEIKADKMAIGGVENTKKYRTHFLQLQKGDTVYLFSDGYADQFGGPKSKKFMYKQFKQLLITIQEQPMEEQKNILDKTILNWRGDLDQIDDICVMGVRI